MLVWFYLISTEKQFFSHLIKDFEISVAFMRFFSSPLISKIKSAKCSKEKHWLFIVSIAFRVRSISSVRVHTVWYSLECCLEEVNGDGFCWPLDRADLEVHELFSSEFASKIIIFKLNVKSKLSYMTLKQNTVIMMGNVEMTDKLHNDDKWY